MRVFSASDRTRTYDPAVNSRLLYQLSYRGNFHLEKTEFIEGLKQVQGHIGPGIDQNSSVSFWEEPAILRPDSIPDSPREHPTRHQEMTLRSRVFSTKLRPRHQRVGTVGEAWFPSDLGKGTAARPIHGKSKANAMVKSSRTARPTQNGPFEGVKACGLNRTYGLWASG